MRTKFWTAAAACAVLCATAPSALARPTPLHLASNAPSIAHATIANRALHDNETYGTLLEGTQVSVSGAHINPMYFAFGAIGGAMGAVAAQNENRAHGAMLGAFAHTDVRAALNTAMTTPEAPPAPEQAAAAPAADGAAVVPTSASAVVAPASSPTPALEGPAYELVPVIQATFTDDTHFKYACIITASLPLRMQRVWRARAYASMDQTFDAESPDSLAQASAQVDQCMRRAYNILSLYIDHNDRFGAARQFRLGNARMEYPVVTDAIPDQVVVNDNIGVASYTASSVTLN